MLSDSMEDSRRGSESIAVSNNRVLVRTRYSIAGVNDGHNMVRECLFSETGFVFGRPAHIGKRLTIRSKVDVHL